MPYLEGVVALIWDYPIILCYLRLPFMQGEEYLSCLLYLKSL